MRLSHACRQILQQRLLLKPRQDSAPKRLCRWGTFLLTCFVLALLVGLEIGMETECRSYVRVEKRARVLVIKTRDNALYNPMVEGLIAGLKARGYRTGDHLDLVIMTLSGKGEDDSRQTRSQLGKHPLLVVAVGTDAALLLAKEKTELPVLFSMLLDPVSLGLVKTLEAPGGNFSGTTLLVSPGKQLDSLLQAVPTAHKIGVLYTDEDAASLALLTEARKEAARLHVEIIAQAVKPADMTVQALARLEQPDAVWLIPDPASTGPQALKATLEFARMHHLAVLGASSGSVRAGAMLALSANLQDLGDLTADMAAHILDGSETPAKMRVRGPRLTLLSINLDTARALGLKPSDAMLHLADEVVDTRKEGE